MSAVEHLMLKKTYEKSQYHATEKEHIQLLQRLTCAISVRRNINENSFIYGAIDTLAEQLKAGGENEQSI